jgi:hypothetical protein
MEKLHLHYSSPKMYRSCWITVLVLPIHAFGEAIIEISKIHNLFIHIQIMHILVCWNPLKNGDKTHKIFLHFNDSN